VKPDCEVGNGMDAAFSQMVAGIPVMVGVVTVLTIMLVVAIAAHCPAFGVNVSVILPLKPVGLKLLPATPVPDQLPVIPLCVVGNDIGAEVSHKLAGIPEMAGATGVLTVIVVVFGLAHWGAFGVNVKIIFPLNPEGLKLFADTPVPDQLPLIPLCVVGREIGAAFSHILAGIPLMAGVTGVLTVILVVVVLAH
jgi:hypothetical protein